MKFGLTKEQFDFILQNVVRPLKEHEATVWCYGSRSRGDHKKYSDLDLMVESELDLSQTIEIIKENLSNSGFPYKVDLVPLSEFAESYKPTYRRDRKMFES